MLEDVSPKRVLQRAFPGIREEEAYEMAAVGNVREYPINTVLCREGALESTFYIILDGRVEVTKEMDDKQNKVMNHLSVGGFFGEMALIHDSPRAATVTSITPVTVLEIQKYDFNRLLERSTIVSLAMVREVSRRLQENDEMAIEDLRLKARELAEAYQQLAEMEYARSEFLTTMAHELRTPLSAASGFLQVIQKGMLQGEALDVALDTVGNNLQDIIALVNDLMFVQEMDLILPEFQPVDIGAFAANTIEEQRSKASRAGISIQLKIGSDIPKVNGDPKSLGRAFRAILDNAIKFSPDGGNVEVEVGSNLGEAWIAFQDYGVGIPPDAMSRIYDRFFHLDEVNGHLFRGIGLGLSIARQVIEQHQGRIEVQSEFSKGSLFTIYLPAIRD